ncbi:hypothetical protein BD410DRAFT_786563 [Rickenella mellea]|uniref:F-box domain-containing protein n=1 Tax=Rickenella mellea TaxID=50990 RepID=A0A4Y7Q8W7_9AGAM|nr:hypothetical protein BD410DRAFT_786563 [Rickenella mellea]
MPGSHLDPDLEAQMQIDAQIRPLNERRNTFAKISRLPPELMAKIFYIITISKWDGCLPCKRFAFTRVCRLWREVALNSPLLWTHTNVSRCDEFEEFIRRSKTVPFSCRLPLVSNSCLEPRAILSSQIFGLLLDQVPRLHELLIHTSFLIRNEPLSEVFSLHAPRLEKLQINGQHSSGSIQRISLLSSHYPNLKKLHINGASMDYNFGCFRGLRTLTISHLTSPHSPTLKELLSVLQASPDLKSLALQNLALKLPKELTPGDIPAISLLKLQHLLFTFQPDIPRFLSFLTLADTVQWVVNIDIPNVVDQNLFVPQTITTKAVCQTICVAMHDFRNYLDAAIVLPLHHNHIVKRRLVVEDTLNSFEPVSFVIADATWCDAVGLDIKFYSAICEWQCNINMPSLTTLLANFTRLSTIWLSREHCTRCDTTIKSFLRSLMVPSNSPQNACLLPNLKNLHLNWSLNNSTLDEILECLQHRSAHAMRLVKLEIFRWESEKWYTYKKPLRALVDVLIVCKNAGDRFPYHGFGGFNVIVEDDFEDF